MDRVCNCDGPHRAMCPLLGPPADEPAKRWTVRHYEWDDAGHPYGWHVLRDGQIIDTYADREMAEGYADYMNSEPKGVTFTCAT